MAAGIDSIIDALVAGASPRDVFAGCTDEELEAVRLDQGVSRLPRDYARFLERVGRKAGPLLRGSNAFYPGIIGIKSAVRELLEEDGSSLRLGSESLVISMHQGYQFFWFPSVLEENLTVLMYEEGTEGVMREWDSFADYLLAEHNPFRRLEGR